MTIMCYWTADRPNSVEVGAVHSDGYTEVVTSVFRRSADGGYWYPPLSQGEELLDRALADGAQLKR